MADKKIQIKTFSGDNAFPVTKLENITMTAHPMVLPETWSPGPAVMVMFSSFVTGKALSPENVLI